MGDLRRWTLFQKSGSQLNVPTQRISGHTPTTHTFTKYPNGDAFSHNCDQCSNGVVELESHNSKENAALMDCHRATLERMSPWPQ